MRVALYSRMSSQTVPARQTRSAGGFPIAFFRTALALIVLAAIAVQFHEEYGRDRFNFVNFFSFFTIVSNLYGAFVLLTVTFGVSANAHARDVLRGAATLALAIVGIVFSILLANLESDVIPWVNTILHFVMPIAIVLDWCFDPPQTRLTRRDAAAWFTLPAAYVLYVLIRGASMHWYPYPFLNADAIGYRTVGIYVIAIAAFTLLVAYVLTVVGNTLRQRKQRLVESTPLS